MKKFLNLLSLFMMSVFMTSCHDSQDTPLVPDWPKSNHTLLIYMTADNNLSSYCPTNLHSCINGLLNWKAPINLVIYEDNRSYGEDGLPKLYQLKRNFINQEKVDTIMLHQYETEHDSTDPTILSAIVKEAFEACPAEIKGLELWSHGLGWAPGDSYQPTTRAQQYIGIDNASYLEIWDLRKALEQGPHLDYLIFDACNMAQAEVAYELCNTADYMLACPTEIMGEGLPYAQMVKSLSACTSKSQIVPALTEIFEEFSSHYPGTGTIINPNDGTLTLCDLKQVSTLRLNYLALLSACQDRHSLLREKPHTYESYLQRFGRTSIYSTYCFYDMQSVADFMVNGQKDIPQYKQFTDALHSVVLKEYHTNRFIEVPIKTCCGLGVGVPEIFGEMATNRKRLLSAYNELQWVKD